jgi:CHAT domain-containing protein
MLRRSVAEPTFSENIHEAFYDYNQVAYELFELLFSGFSENLANHSLLIIPDGALWYIPFEVLLTSMASDSVVDYRNLPYLIRNYPISYTYSATLHFDVNTLNPLTTTNLLAFAPSYSNLFAQVELPEETGFLERYREHLIPIPGVKEEVKMITKLVDGDVYLDEDATETHFKQKAEDYDILHLAMHTIVNNEDPMYSKLAFVQNVDTANDGFLNTYEIYNMRFNARMAVLSSCKTGFGKLMKGEGVMSLARGFMYAGCPSIVMTLWEVSDKSGAKLMQDFYQSLIKGKTKAEALQEAKLEFLKKADNLKANPYFWSTYVVIGDASPIYEKDMSRYYWLAGILLITGGAITIFMIRRKKNQKSSEFKPDTMYT